MWAPGLQRRGEGAAALDPVTPHESTAHELTIVATTTPVSAPAPTSARVWPTSSPCAPMTDGGAEHHDVDGDGCSEPVTVTAGAVVVGDRRYEIGTLGESVAVSDWDCDGRATPAVLRPDTGELFVFDSWAGVDAPATARLLQTFRGTVSLRGGEPRCGVLTVVDESGVATMLEVGE